MKEQYHEDFIIRNKINVDELHKLVYIVVVPNLVRITTILWLTN